MARLEMTYIILAIVVLCSIGGVGVYTFIGANITKPDVNHPTYKTLHMLDEKPVPWKKWEAKYKAADELTREKILQQYYRWQEGHLSELKAEGIDVKGDHPEVVKIRERFEWVRGLTQTR